ncbi:amidase family protein [Leucobacter luti]|uniref:amidase family protein n=1 Tax=Leucobacter luti TaxID=340320 RepID=UPI00286822D4|nr:amidase family protein [Leucobacter luti]
MLRAAGAISLGKTQVPEFGLTGYSENLIAPPARNPLDPERTAGGSSGGSAAAVAAGMLALAPASDGGGSIRIPALACGLIGLKPGLGAIPADMQRGPHDEFGAPRLTVTGPLARSAADAALLFDAMRAEPGDPAEPAVAAVQRADALTGLRIGVSATSPFEAAHPVPLSPRPGPRTNGPPRCSQIVGTGSRRRTSATIPSTHTPSPRRGRPASRCSSSRKARRNN